jgi:hypothetical protein
MINGRLSDRDKQTVAYTEYQDRLFRGKTRDSSFNALSAINV